MALLSGQNFPTESFIVATADLSAMRDYTMHIRNNLLVCIIMSVAPDLL
jgi:hypothetical protein